jgi:predicted RNase H-like HicB family nuclease
MKAERKRLELPRRFIERGRRIASAYTVVLEPHEAEGFCGRTLELPNVRAYGRTQQRCIAELYKVQAIAVGSMLAHGQTPPPPAVEGKRDDQVNIKLTRREKAFFTEAARREGFRSVADFLRSLAMRRLH